MRGERECDRYDCVHPNLLFSALPPAVRAQPLELEARPQPRKKETACFELAGMPPKAPPKKAEKNEDPELADARGFFKRYNASSSANGLEPLPLPHPEGALTLITVRCPANPALRACPMMFHTVST